MSKVEIFEKERATNYDKFVETWIPNYHYFLDILPKLLNEIDNKDLLVVGCGTGNEIKRFASIKGNWKITGIDPSPDMINQAKKKLIQYNNVTLIEGLISDQKIDKKYSVATLLLVLHFLEDNGNKLNLLKDIAKRLISGATFVILDITGDRNQIKKNLKVLKLLLPEKMDEEQIKNRLDRIENQLFTVSEERMIQLFKLAGFIEPVRFYQSSIYMGWLVKKK